MIWTVTGYSYGFLDVVRNVLSSGQHQDTMIYTEPGQHVFSMLNFSIASCAVEEALAPVYLHEGPQRHCLTNFDSLSLHVVTL